MTMRFHVPGPVSLEVSLTPPTGVASWKKLGYSHNQELISVESIMNDDLTTSTRTGEVPGEIVHNGSMDVITYGLSEWDDDTLDDMKKFIYDVPDMGVVPPVGKTYLNEHEVATAWRTIRVRINPVLAGRKRRTYLRCFILDRPTPESWGNTGLTLVGSFQAIPHVADLGSNGTLWVEDTTD